jgi:hypothetical protein
MQHIFKLNEYFLIVDRIQKAGRSARQGNGRLRNKLLNSNGDGDASVPPPLTSLEISAQTFQYAGS